MKLTTDCIWTDKKRTIFGLPISFTRYILTDKKLLTRKGFFNIEEDEIELYRISDKSLKLSFWQRIFGCGSIIMHCKDTDTPVKEIKSVKKPREVSDILEKHIDIQRDKYRVRGRDLIGSGMDSDDIDIDGGDNNA